MKQKDLNTIWRIPKYLPYIQPPLTDEIITAAEKKIGYKLPKEYLELLKIQNGGYIRFTLKDTLHNQISGIGPYYPSITNFDWLNEYEDLSFEIKGLFPFDGDGHWNICLDYRNNTIEPEVTYIDTETDYEQHIASTFSDYLNLLELDTENKFVIETSSTIDTVLKQISEIANIEFEAPDSWSHGYTMYRSSYKDSWIWISPNLVPSGFVRENDERYNELKSQMETSALRYPEIPESALFINVSEELVQQELFARLAMGGITIRRLKELT
jgi:SMI1 / KNR4 family (SUKH-1)